MSKEKLIILFTVFIDVIGLGIIIPTMPTYVYSFGASPSTITILFSVFALFSFLSTPVLGALSDKIGRRPILMVSILSSSIGWFVFASAHSLLVLFLGRIIDGLAAGNFSTAQSAISDVSKDQKERSANLGLVGMIFGIGFLLGPLLGGLLSKVSHVFPFWFVACLALLNFILAYFFLPETNKNLHHDKQITWNPLSPIVSALKDLKLRKLYVTWFLFSSIAMGTNTIFALYLLKVFNFGAFESGLYFTGIGIIIAFNQGFALKRFWLKYFTEKKLIVMMLGIFGLGYLVMAYPVLWFFIFGLVLTSFGQSVLRVAIASEIMGETDPRERGQASGILASLMNGASIISPLIMGQLFEMKVGLPYVTAAILCVLTLVYIAGRKFPRIIPTTQV
jgi:DHA1 family tetracycline resistance protein-like MFS transporter